MKILGRLELRVRHAHLRNIPDEFRELVVLDQHRSHQPRADEDHELRGSEAHLHRHGGRARALKSYSLPSTPSNQPRARDTQPKPSHLQTLVPRNRTRFEISIRIEAANPELVRDEWERGAATATARSATALAACAAERLLWTPRRLFHWWVLSIVFFFAVLIFAGGRTRNRLGTWKRGTMKKGRSWRDS